MAGVQLQFLLTQRFKVDDSDSAIPVFLIYSLALLLTLQMPFVISWIIPNTKNLLTTNVVFTTMMNRNSVNLCEIYCLFGLIRFCTIGVCFKHALSEISRIRFISRWFVKWSPWGEWRCRWISHACHTSVKLRVVRFAGETLNTNSGICKYCVRKILNPTFLTLLLPVDRLYLKMASVKFPDKQLTELRAFVSLIKAQPSILSQPELQFFKDYLESIGGVIPTADRPKCCPMDHGEHKSETRTTPPKEEEPELVESDVELDVTGVIGKLLFFLNRTSFPAECSF